MTRFVFLFFQLLVHLPKARSAIFYTSHVCSDPTTYFPNSKYGSDLRTLLTILSNNSTTRFNTATIQTGEKIEALYQCRSDVSLEECQSCVHNATIVVNQKCPFAKTAVIWYDKCLLRFSNKTIVSVLSLSPLMYIRNPNNVPDTERGTFTSIVLNDLYDSTTKAANSPWKFAVMNTNTNVNLSFTDHIYSLVQCTADLSKDECSQCLWGAFGTFSTTTAIGARALMPSCTVRYETFAFYNVTGVAFASSPSSVRSFISSTTESPTSGKRRLSNAEIIAIVFSIGFLATVFGIGCFVFIRRRVSTLNVKETGSMRKESLMFNLSSLIEATNDFATQNLLGHGGYGDVFMGTLKNGQEIAVKRLVENSFQGETEFKNEVSLVTNLQHKNLTRLLGFCLEGEERIPIYEYVPNKSLDIFLFEKEGGGALKWPERYKIIEGIARGMLYRDAVLARRFKAKDNIQRP